MRIRLSTYPFDIGEFYLKLFWVVNLTHHVNDGVRDLVATQGELLLNVDPFATKECSDGPEDARFVFVDNSQTGLA